MFDELSKESGNLLHQGCLNGEDTQSYKQALQVSESCPQNILEEINTILSPPSFNVFSALAGLIRIINRELKTIILISKKIPPPLQRLLSQGDSQGVSFVASPTRTNLLQDANYMSGMEVLHQGHSTLNILAVKSDESSSKLWETTGFIAL